MGLSDLTVIVTLTFNAETIALIDYNGAAYYTETEWLRHIRDDQYSIATYHLDETHKIMNQPSAIEGLL
jgi:hypothetical protein